MAMMNPKLMFTFMLLVLLISLEVCAVPDHGGGASEPMRRLEVMPSSPLPILGGAFYEPIPVSAAGGEVSGPYPSGGDIGGKASVQHRVPSRDISQADDDHVSAAGGEVSGPYPSGGDIGEGSETRGPLQSREAELPAVSFPGGKASVQHRVPSREISQADDDHENYLAEGELEASDPSDQFDRSWLKCKRRCIYKLKACMVHSCCSSLLGGHRHKQYCHNKSCQKKRKKCLKLMQ